MTATTQKKNVSVQISPKTLAILDNIAEQADISRHKLIHDILELTIRELEFGAKIGFFQMIVLIKKLARKIAVETEAIEENSRNIPIRLSEDYLTRLDKLAKQADRSRHYLTKKFVEVGAEELNRLYNGKPLVTTGIMMTKLKKELDRLCTEGEKALSIYADDSTEEK